MSREVVVDDVDLSVRRLRGDDLVEEGDEGVARMTLSGHTFDVTGVDLERCIEGRACRGGHTRSRASPPAQAKRGRIGSLRSRAWMAVFSSTQNTAAWAGGSR
jgi:hypothetical protein